MDKIRNDLQGWSGIISEMRKQLRPYDAVLKIKEKWGELRVSYDVLNGTESERQAVKKIIEHAVEMSSKTCQYCGVPAETEVINGCHITLCDSCRNKWKNGYRPFFEEGKLRW